MVSANEPRQASRSPLRLAMLFYLAGIFLLAWMRQPLTFATYDVYPVDLAFAAAGGLWLVQVLRRHASVELHRGFWLLSLYLAALSLSVIRSADPQASAFKLLSQLYLVGLAVLTVNLVREVADIRRVFAWWLAGAGVVAALGVGTLLMFPFAGRDSPLMWGLHPFGTLPAGPYPRLEVTFLYPAMLANYLGASVTLLLIGRTEGWYGRRASIFLGLAIFVTALFALTPGFGGVLFMIAMWLWYKNRERSQLFARASFGAGLAMVILMVTVAAVSVTLHPSAPFLFHVPGVSQPVAPGIRLLMWIEAVRSFLASPVLGHGIGAANVEVAYEAARCDEGCAMDAHNLYLNIAMQAGLVGLSATLAIIWFVAGRLRHENAQSQVGPILFGLSLAWFSGFAVQGLVGSFEDLRHLWILFGLILSATTMVRRNAGEGDAASGLR